MHRAAVTAGLVLKRSDKMHAQGRSVLIKVHTSLPLGLNFIAVDRVTSVQCTEVALDGELAIHYGILRHHVRLIKIVRMLHMGPSQTCREKKQTIIHLEVSVSYFSINCYHLAGKIKMT